MTSHALDPLPLSQTVTPTRTPSPLERDVLYGRPQNSSLVVARFYLIELSVKASFNAKTASLIVRQTDKQTARQTDGQTNRQTDGRTDRRV